MFPSPHPVVGLPHGDDKIPLARHLTPSNTNDTSSSRRQNPLHVAANALDMVDDEILKPKVGRDEFCTIHPSPAKRLFDDHRSLYDNHDRTLLEPGFRKLPLGCSATSGDGGVHDMAASFTPRVA